MKKYILIFILNSFTLLCQSLPEGQQPFYENGQELLTTNPNAPIINLRK